MSESASTPAFGARLFYRDPKAAIEWLEKAFGFETTLYIEDGEGKFVTSEMRLGDSYLIVSGEWTDPAWMGAAAFRSPSSVGGANTQVVHVRLQTDLDAHCRRARAAGAVITHEPEEQFYGDRNYFALDPEGHVWDFSVHQRDVSRAEAEAATGMKFKAKGWD